MKIKNIWYLVLLAYISQYATSSQFDLSITPTSVQEFQNNNTKSIIFQSALDVSILAASLYIMFTYSNQSSYMLTLISHLVGPFVTEEKAHDRIAYLLFGYLLPLCSVYNLYHHIHRNHSPVSNHQEQESKPSFNKSAFCKIIFGTSIFASTLYVVAAYDDNYCNNLKSCLWGPIVETTIKGRLGNLLLGYILPLYSIQNIFYGIKTYKGEFNNI